MRAQFGISREPMLECFMQTPTDPSLAPPGKHILSIFAQYFPYDRTDRPWRAGDRDAIADRIVAQLAAYAPNLPGAIEHRQILAPPDLEAMLGLCGRPHLPRRAAARAKSTKQRFGVRPGSTACICAVRERIPAAASAAFRAARRAAVLVDLVGAGSS